MLTTQKSPGGPARVSPVNRRGPFIDVRVTRLCVTCRPTVDATATISTTVIEAVPEYVTTERNAQAYAFACCVGKGSRTDEQENSTVEHRCSSAPDRREP